MHTADDQRSIDMTEAKLVSRPPLPKSMDPSICAVVCVHTMERLDQIKQCIRSIRSGIRQPEELLVVVDQNPSLRDCLLAEMEGEQIIDNNGRGLADARTTALNVAKSDVVAFIDDDAWAEPTWLAELHRVFHDPAVIGAGGMIVPEWEDPRLALPAEIYWIVGSTYLGHRTDVGPISRPIGANMAVRREALRELGGFSSSFGRQAGVNLRSNEELAAFTSVTNRFGNDCVRFVPTATVHHFAPKTRCSLRYVLRRSKAEGISKADIRQLHGSASMDTDRAYARNVIFSGFVGYFGRALRTGELRTLRSSMLIAAAFCATALSYVLRMIGLFIRQRNQMPPTHSVVNQT